MTALLELKQRIKNFYGRCEVYLLPVFRFALAMLYFQWINFNMGYMTQLNNIFVTLILALVCSILPSAVMVYVGMVLMIGHSYALGIETAGFMLVLLLLMIVFFLRFSGGQNLVIAFTPLSFTFNITALLPIGAGLLGNPLSAIPAACGVILRYFIRYIRTQYDVLSGTEKDALEKIKVLTDGLAQNWEMWIVLVTFVVVILLVNLIRTRSFDYAWRIAIVAGAFVYVFLRLSGSYLFGVNVSMSFMIISTLAVMLIGFVLEFFAFGGDYSRVEKLEYEDDEYIYYVKAVPKASVTTSERSIKKINAEPVREERRRRAPEPVYEDESDYYEDDYYEDEREAQRRGASAARRAHPVQKPADSDVDFEKKLEESLKDL